MNSRHFLVIAAVALPFAPLALADSATFDFIASNGTSFPSLADYGSVTLVQTACPTSSCQSNSIQVDIKLLPGWYLVGAGGNDFAFDALGSPILDITGFSSPNTTNLSAYSGSIEEPGDIKNLAGGTFGDFEYAVHGSNGYGGNQPPRVNELEFTVTDCGKDATCKTTANFSTVIDLVQANNSHHDFDAHVYDSFTGTTGDIAAPEPGTYGAIIGAGFLGLAVSRVQALRRRA